MPNPAPALVIHRRADQRETSVYSGETHSQVSVYSGEDQPAQCFPSCTEASLPVHLSGSSLVVEEENVNKDCRHTESPVVDSDSVGLKETELEDFK